MIAVKLRLRLFFLLLAICCSFQLIQAQQGAIEQFKLANTQYQEGNLKQAKNSYLELLQKGFFSDDLHYNLGNTFFRLKNFPSAILHYEKALKINPANEDAAFNLKMANQKTIDKVEPIPELFVYRWWKSIYNLFSANNWAKITIGLFFLFVIFFGLFLFSSQRAAKKVSFFIAAISFVLGSLSWLLAFQQNRYFHSEKHAIIMQATVNVISAPSEGSSQLFVLHEGTKVQLKERSNSWIKIALPNGNEGWVENDDLATI